jgi:hypothetical protein
METIKSKKRLYVSSLFNAGSGMKKGRFRIRDEKMCGSGIEPPGSATLIRSQSKLR